MNRISLLLLPLLALLATPALAKDDKLSEPPPGITPSAVTVSQVLKSYDAAVGKLKAGIDDTRQETWHFTDSGLAGSESLTRAGFNFRSKIVTGPIVNEYGQLAGHRWHKDPNGFVTPLQGVDVTSFEMQIFMENFGDAEDAKNDVKVLGEASDPKPAYVLQITRPNYRHPEWVFYDKKSGLVDQIVNVVSSKRYTVTYDNYKTTKGLTQPWHLHVTDGRPTVDQDFTRETLQIGVATDLRSFVEPADSASFATYNGHVELPARVISEELAMSTGWLNGYQIIKSPTVVIRVNVNGRGLDFELSTGDPESYIDWDVAQQLGLPAYGQTLRMPNGNPIDYYTVMPSAQIGGLSLHNIVLHALRFNYNLLGSTQVVGTLGYDVLKAGVFKIDYDNGKVTLDPASTFETLQPVTGSFSVPLHFDNGHAFMEALVASHITQNIWLANNFELSCVFGHFTSQYPDSVKDTTGRNHGTTFVPFADAGSYGREVDVWYGTIPDIQFSQAHFVDYSMLGSNGNVEFSGHPVDAVVGADFLKYYDVYLDYPHGRLLLKPNRSFYNFFRAK